MNTRTMWRRIIAATLTTLGLAAAFTSTATVAQADPPPPNGRIVTNHNQVLL